MIFLQRSLQIFIIWAKVGKQTPKIFAMIHVFSVAKFVQHHIIHQLERQLHKPNVQADRTLRATTTPTRAGAAKTQLTIVKAMLVSKRLEPPRQIRLGLRAPKQARIGPDDARDEWSIRRPDPPNTP